MAPIPHGLAPATHGLAPILLAALLLAAGAATLLPGAQGHPNHPMIVGLAPDLPDPSLEAIAVGSNAAWDLSGWTVTDGEGTLHLPSLSLPPGQPLWLTGNLPAWQAHGGAAPAQGWQSTGRFQLSNSGEGLRLLDPAGAEVDAFAWGDGEKPGMQGNLTYTSKALLYQRDAGWPDTDHARDWATPRAHRLGESYLGPASFTVAEATLYSSPDSSHAVLSALVAGARERLHLHVYELASLSLAQHLADAKRAHPALDLQVLVDSQPVGLTASERHRATQALLRIQDAGGHVVLSGHGRYAYHHLKVLVADDAVAVQSENWVESGVPRDPTSGNRGWGVALRDAALADWFAAWLAQDRAAWDATPFDAAAFDPAFEPVPEAAPRTGGYGPVVPARTVTGAIRVTPLVAPDHTQDPRRDPLARLVDGARESVAVQQLDLRTAAVNRLGWSSGDPLAEALARAAGRGVRVQVLAAAPFARDDAGNQPALDWLAARGAEARVMDRPGLGTLHNKGLVVDGAAVVVGSMNGNHHSRSANREVAVVLEHPEVAAFYRGLFDGDWAGRGAGPDGSVVARDVHALPWAPLPSLLAMGAVALVLRVRRA